MKVDVVILTKTNDFFFYGVTCRAINTLRKTTRKSIDLNVIVVESNRGRVVDGTLVRPSGEMHLDYDGCMVVSPDEAFNYNRFLNSGLAFCDGDYTLICNNDIIFTDGSVQNLVECMARNGIGSACPLEPNWHSRHFSPEELRAECIKGHRVMHEICGWCICMSHGTRVKMGKMDESFSYYYSDNDYAMRLQNLGIDHFLVTRSIVKHEFSASRLLVSKTHDDLTSVGRLAFENKYK